MSAKNINKSLFDNVKHNFTVEKFSNAPRFIRPIDTGVFL